MDDRKTRATAMTGVLIALAFVLAYVEFLIPISLGVPGVKLGLANLAGIIALYLLGTRRAAEISLIRVILTGITFGNMSMMIYSMAGAACSLAAMSLCKSREIFGLTGVSIVGGIVHNAAQLAVAMLVLETGSLFYYFPVLLLAGSAAGTVIGLTAGAVIRRISRIFRRLDEC